MKNPATIFIILLIAITPSLAQFDNATCLKETKELTSNQNITSAYADLQASLESDLKANPLEFCKVASINPECEINIAVYSGNLTSACKAEGGQLIEKDLTATCNGDVMGVPLNDFKVVVYSAPLCASASCDPKALPSELETELETVLQDVMEEVNTAVGGSLQCDVSINAVGTTTSGVQATSIWTSAAGVALFSFIMM